MSNLTLGSSFILNSDIVLGQEIKTGGTYNGKPIYCYTNSFSGTPSTNSYTTITGATINNLKDVIRLEGIGWGWWMDKSITICVFY